MKLYYKGPIKQRGLITKPEKKCQKKTKFLFSRPAKWDLGRGRATSDVTSGTELKHSRDFSLSMLEDYQNIFGLFVIPILSKPNKIFA